MVDVCLEHAPLVRRDYRPLFILIAAETHTVTTTIWEAPSSSLILLGNLAESAETVDVGLGGDSSGGVKGPCTTSNLSAGLLAFPDADGLTLDALLTGEGGEVLSLLGDFEFLDDLSEGGTELGAVLADDSYLLCSLCHYVI